MTKRISIGLLVLSWILSLLVRWPHINRPVSYHYEYNTAMVLLGIEAWQQTGGIRSTGGVPIMNYRQAGDIRMPDGQQVDHLGNRPYFSFGPGWYLYPALLFKLGSVDPTPLALQVLNLIFQAWSAIMLFLILGQLLPRGHETARFLGVHFFLWLPGLLWFLGNGYIHVGVALPFILTAWYGCIGMQEGKDFRLLVVVSSLLAVYADWFPVFLVIAVFGWGIWKFQLSFFRYRWPWYLAGGVIGGIILIIWQYLSYERVSFILHRLSGRWEERTAHGILLWKGFYQLVSERALTMYGISMLVLGLTWLGSRHEWPSAKPNRFALFFMTTWTLACLIHNGLFLQWTIIHEFSILFWSLLPVWWMAVTGLKKSVVRYRYLLALVIMLAGTAGFLYMNPIHGKSVEGLPYTDHRRLGLEIAARVKPDQAIYLNLDEPNAMQVMYYAKRRVEYADTPEEAMEKHRGAVVKEGIWFRVENMNIREMKILQR